MPAFEYAPAPESRSIVDLKPSYGLFIDGKFVDPADGGSFKTINPATEEVLAEVAEAGPADVDRAVAAARARVRQGLGPHARPRPGQVPLPDRPDHPGARPRAGRAGVARQRQADPRVARRRHPAGRRALLLLRGLGRQAAARRVRRRPAPARRGRPGHPVELPAADAGVEDRAGAGRRQHGGAQAGRDDAADRAAVRGDLPAGRPAAGRGQHRHRRRRDRRGAGRAPRRGQGRVHRLDRGRPGDRPVGRRHAARRSPWSWAARPPTSSSTTPRSTRPSRASSTASSSTRATCAARARGCWCRSRCTSEVLASLKRRMAQLRVGDPLDKNTDIGAINSAAQLARIRTLSDIGSEEGAERWSPPCELPDRGFWFAPTIFTGVTQAHRIAREEIFGPVLSVLTFRTPAEAVEKANNTPYGLSAGVWTDKGSRILWMADRLRAGVVWANTFNKFDPTSPFGGYKESGYGREGGRHGLEAYLECLTVLAVRKTYKLFIGGAFPRSESGRSYVVAGRQRGAGVPQGRARRGGGGARRGRRSGPARPPTTGGRSSTGSPRCWRAGATQFADLGVSRRPRWTRRSTAGSGTPAGPTRSPRSTAAPTRSPGRTSTSPRPSRPAWWASWRRPSLLGLVQRGRAGDRHRQHRAWCWPPGTRRWPR